MAPRLEVERLTKRFGAVVALDDVSLSVAPGESVVVLGPSGCGKTTLLRLIAGLESPTAGDLRIDGRSAEPLAPHERHVGFVFQDPALYPHLTVFENLAFGLRLRRGARADIERQVTSAAEWLGLTELLARRPAELSGGERQRVAIGRAVVREPALLLLDEPLTHLDAPLRASLRDELRRLQRRLGLAMLYVTHDQEDALVCADRLVILNRGRVQQSDVPRVVYDRPANRFVAEFFGTTRINFIEARFAPSELGGQVVLGERRWPLPPVCAPSLGAEAPVLLGVRPEDVRATEPTDPAARLVGRPVAWQDRGRKSLVTIETGTATWRVFSSREDSSPATDLVGLTWQWECCHWFDVGGPGQALPRK